MLLALIGSYNAAKALGRQVRSVACSAYSQKHDGTHAVMHAFGPQRVKYRAC